MNAVGTIEQIHWQKKVARLCGNLGKRREFELIGVVNKYWNDVWDEGV